MSHESSAGKIYPVQDAVREKAQIKGVEAYSKFYRASTQDPDAFWEEQAKRLDWFHPHHSVLDYDFRQAHISWFNGGKLNVSYNCLDRHLQTRGDETAIIWESDDPADAKHYSYRELHREVCRVANALKAAGVKKGDRVCMYLPMIPELAFSMLACARIGAIHSIVFAGFSAESIRDRILDCGASVVITANEGWRGGKRLPLKEIVDQACADLDLVQQVFVARRTEKDVPMQSGRDVWLDEAMRRQNAVCPAEWMDAEDPLFILYTSGSTGKPKGVLHTTGGYLLYAAFTHQYVFDYQPGDIYFCAADIGWVTGHTYIVYGPLANGATTIMFESTPMYPNPGRYWDVVARHKVNIFYTAPTAIRALEAEGNDWVTRHDRSSLRVLGTVGEPINHEAWEWYYEVVGEGNCAIVDTWWQTETGGIMITPQPGVTDLKPGSATLPFYGVQPALVDEQGRELTDQEATGLLCIKYPWPGMARTIYGDHQRFIETYFARFPGYYFTGDGCHRDADGYYWITGRVDDVLNVSGHRLGTAEIESAICDSDYIAESAVVGYPHAIKGVGIFAFVVLNKAHENADDEAVTQSAIQCAAEGIGKIARPDRLMICKGLPKTRSGKIMRRILRKIAVGEYTDMGNITTLADPAVVQELIDTHKRRFPA